MDVREIETLWQVVFVLGVMKLLEKPIKILVGKALDKALDKAFDKALEYFSEKSKESRKNLEEKNESQGNGG
jgi:hypothetical protein